MGFGLRRDTGIRTFNMDARDTFVVVCTRIGRDMGPILESLKKNPFRGKLLTESEIDNLLSRVAPVMLTDRYAPVENLLAGVVRQDRSLALTRYLKDASSLANQNEFAASEAMFRRALKISPMHPTAHYGLGVVYLKKGEPDAAIELFTRSLEADPGDHDVRNHRALLLAQSGQVEKAIAEWQLILQQDPESVAAHNDLGNAYALEKDFDSAMVHWQEAMRLDPSSSSTMNNIGKVFSLKGQPDEALAHFRKALEFDPNALDALINLSQELGKAGEMDEARRALGRVERIRPDDPRVEVLKRRLKGAEK